MKYRDYNFEDFIKDEFFKQWVKSPDKYSEDFWKSFLHNNPQKREDIQKAQYFISSLQFAQKDYIPPSKEEVERSYAEVISSHHKEIHQIGRRQKLRVLYVAASVSVMFLLSFIGYWFIQGEGFSESSGTATIELIDKQAPYGQKLTIKLPDGSTVKLNSGSRISYPRIFSDDQRMVTVEGEAFFHVAKDIYKPFMVKTKNLQTTVLGTSFLVKAYKDEEKIQVAVLTGKVLVEKQAFGPMGQNDKLYLLPMEGITYSRNEDVYKKEKIDYNEFFSWKDNVLYFENASFQEVIKKLSKWYGKEFEIKSEISSKEDFNGVYKNQSLELVMEGVSFAFGFDYKIENKKVIIY